MNTKFTILSLSLAAALGVTSCSSDEPVPGDNTQTTTYTVIPDELTRADGSEVSVDELQYALYDSQGTFLLGDATEGAPKPVYAGGKFTVTFELIGNRTYYVAFWAVNSAGDDGYTFNRETGEMTVDYTKVPANSNTADAFFGYKAIIGGDGGKTFTLTRPFTMVNFGQSPVTTESVTDVALTATGIPTVFNLKTGKVSGATSIATTAAAVADGEFPVNPTTTTWLGRFYLLSTDVTVDTGVTIVDGSTVAPVVPANPLQAAMTLTYKIDGKEYSNSFTKVPLTANYRVNIFGDLLGTKTTVDVGTDPDFGGDFDINP